MGNADSVSVGNTDVTEADAVADTEDGIRTDMGGSTKGVEEGDTEADAEDGTEANA